MTKADSKLTEEFRRWLATRAKVVKPNGLDAEIQVPLEDVRAEFGADAQSLLDAHASDVQELEPGVLTVLGVAVRQWTQHYGWSLSLLP